MRGQLAFNAGDSSDTPRMLLDAAKRFEPIDARLNLTPHYLKTFTGVAPAETEVDALRAYALRHAHVPDFGPSRGHE